MRLIFIPGFGEDPSIFDRIHPHIAGEKVFVDNRTLLGNNPRPGLTAPQYARELIDRLGITREDIIIGHSMGGWIALYIKHLVGCPIIQIASWTNVLKVVKIIKNPYILYWLAKRGLAFNPFVKRYMIKKSYQGKPSAGIFSSVFENLIRGNKENVLSQLKVIYNPVHENITVTPELRIHAKGDNIIRFPDQPTHEVPGDHFTLHTHPEKVYEPINAFLQEHLKPADRQEQEDAHTGKANS